MMGLGQPSVFSSCILCEMVMSTFALLRGDAAFLQFGAGKGVAGPGVTAVGTWLMASAGPQAVHGAQGRGRSDLGLGPGRAAASAGSSTKAVCSPLIHAVAGNPAWLRRFFGAPQPRGSDLPPLLF